MQKNVCMSLHVDNRRVAKYGTSGMRRADVDAFKDDLDQHLVEHPAELTRGVPEMIEVLPPGASKAVGVDALLNHLGISPEEVSDK